MVRQFLFEDEQTPVPAPVSGDSPGIIIRAEGETVTAIIHGRYAPDDAVTLASRLLQEAAKARDERDRKRRIEK